MALTTAQFMRVGTEVKMRYDISFDLNTFSHCRKTFWREVEEEGNVSAHQSRLKSLSARTLLNLSSYQEQQSLSVLRLLSALPFYRCLQSALPSMGFSVQ